MPRLGTEREAVGLDHTLGRAPFRLARGWALVTPRSAGPPQPGSGVGTGRARGSSPGRTQLDTIPPRLVRGRIVYRPLKARKPSPTRPEFPGKIGDSAPDPRAARRSGGRPGSRHLTPGSGRPSLQWIAGGRRLISQSQLARSPESPGGADAATNRRILLDLPCERGAIRRGGTGASSRTPRHPSPLATIRRRSAASIEVVGRMSSIRAREPRIGRSAAVRLTGVSPEGGSGCRNRNIFR